MNYFMKLKSINICPVCKSEKYIELDYGGYIYKDRNMPLVQCNNCFLKYIVHNLEIKDFDDFYNDPKYFDSEYAGGENSDYLSNVKFLKEKSSNVLLIIKKYKKSGNFLEIGCAGGYLLEVARDKFNYSVKGVEVSKEMCKDGQLRGLDIFCGTVDNIPNNWKSFDIVYMGDVMEHIPNPINFMSSIGKYINQNGLIVLELPLTYNLTISGIIIGIINIIKGKFGYKYFLPAQHRNKYEYKPPYHVLMFDRYSIKKFFKQEGYKIKYMRTYEGKPKTKFKGTLFGLLKIINHYITYYLPQNILGDRMIVIAEKYENINTN